MLIRLDVQTAFILILAGILISTFLGPVKRYESVELETEKKEGH